MSEAPKLPATGEAINATDLYVVERYTDLKNGYILAATPVLCTGLRDTKRHIRYFSECAVVFRGQPLPVKFEIPAANLADALTGMHAAASTAASAMLSNLEDQALRRNLSKGTILKAR